MLDFRTCIKWSNCVLNPPSKVDRTKICVKKSCRVQYGHGIREMVGTCVKDNAVCDMVGTCVKW